MYATVGSGNSILFALVVVFVLWSVYEIARWASTSHGEPHREDTKNEGTTLQKENKQ